MGLERTTLAHLDVLAISIEEVLTTRLVATLTLVALLKVCDSFNEKGGSSCSNFPGCRVGANIVIKQSLSLAALAAVALADQRILRKPLCNLGKGLIVRSQSKVEVRLLHLPLLLRTHRVQSTVDFVHRRILRVIFWV